MMMGTHRIQQRRVYSHHERLQQSSYQPVPLLDSYPSHQEYPNEITSDNTNK